MTTEEEGRERLQWVDRVLSDLPSLHPDSVNQMVWSTESSCYRFLAANVDGRSTTLETGVGVSTVLFAAWGCHHTVITPFEYEEERIREYCDERRIDTDHLAFIIAPSESALPVLPSAMRFDLVLLDGCHGFPLPIIDWFYAAGKLRQGGIAVLDDIHLPQVRLLVKQFLAPDPRWQERRSTGKWTAYERCTDGPLSEGEWEQPFFPDDRNGAWTRAKGWVPLNVRKKVRRLLS